MVTDHGVDRRALCVAAGGLLTLTALSGCGSKEAEVTANEDLMREHGILRRILILYREVVPQLSAGGAGVNAKAIADAATIFRDFGEQYHEKQLEEAHIFPAVRKTGGNAAQLVDALLVQHQRGREITEYVIGATQGGRIATGAAAPLGQALSQFARMYEAHAAREDTVIFPAFQKALSKSQYSDLGEQFDDIEKKQFGGDGFDIMEGRVGAIEQALGLADLNTFTAAPPPAAKAANPVS